MLDGKSEASRCGRRAQGIVWLFRPRLSQGGGVWHAIGPTSGFMSESPCSSLPGLTTDGPQRPRRTQRAQGPSRGRSVSLAPRARPIIASASRAASTKTSARNAKADGKPAAPDAHRPPRSEREVRTSGNPAAQTTTAIADLSFVLLRRAKQLSNSSSGS